MHRLRLAILILLPMLLTPCWGEDLSTLRGFASRRHSGAGQKIPAGGTLTLLDEQRAGQVNHIWITLPVDQPLYRHLVLRMFWDGELEPSVEVPLGDFFCQGFGARHKMDSALISIGGQNTGLNCFIPMPFGKSAKIEVRNDGAEDATGFYHYVDYAFFDSPDSVAGKGRFHAQYRQQVPVKPGDYTLFEAAGRGHYIGCNLQTQAQSGGWWGEGDDVFYIDGDAKPTIHGTGSEDYFCNGWGFQDGQCTAYFGSPVYAGRYGRTLMYRFHTVDPIAFASSIRFDFQHQGHVWKNRAEEIAMKQLIESSGERVGDNFYSVAYWYQTEPHAPFPKLPPLVERIPLPLLRGDKVTEIVLDEGMRCTLEGARIAFWSIRPEGVDAGFLEAALDASKLKAQDVLGDPRPMRTVDGKTRFPILRTATYVSSDAVSPDALRAAFEKAGVVRADSISTAPGNK